MRVTDEHLEELRVAYERAKRNEYTWRAAYFSALSDKYLDDIRQKVGPVSLHRPRECVLSFKDGDVKVLILGIDTFFARVKIVVKHANKNGQWSKTTYEYDPDIIPLMKKIEKEHD
jgi:hypothetical protein